jgi:hypothetical protein
MKEIQTGGFHVTVLPGLPGMSPVRIYQFARRGQSTHSEGTVVQVTGAIQSWIGNFQSGHYYNGLTDVIPFRAQPLLCVFAEGCGYRFRLDSPESYAVLDFFPVLGARYISEQDHIVVWDLTRLAAYSADSCVWRSRRVSWDGILITAIRPGHLEGLAWDAINDSDVKFEVDLSTGEHTGGPENLPQF